jgi:branched-chain amino acid transport system ATP-binding protein
MAMALMRRPQIMLFDEPTASLAPKMALKVLDKIISLRDNYGITIVLAEQNARRALEYGDKAVLLVSGKVMHEGGSKELLQHPEIGGVYLGIKTVQTFFFTQSTNRTHFRLLCTKLVRAQDL